MLRLPNPGSDIDIILRIFRDLYASLHERADFNLDDITGALINRNNVSSQGAFGDEALRRSTRPDRSRDPLYNQSKAYAELYRTLGWIHSTTGALQFAFTSLGAHAAGSDDPRQLVVECLLAVAYPNEVLGVQGEQSIRLFPSILTTARDLGGSITRDEIIVGPMSISDDRNPEVVASMIERLSQIRSNPNAMNVAIAELSDKRGITHTTMGNYTRFPISALQWAGWAVKSTPSMLTLTDVGRATLTDIGSLLDVRLSDYRSLPQPAKEPFIRLAFHLMLERSGYDLSHARNDMEADRTTLKVLGVPTRPIPWFSPFQQIASAEVNRAFAHLRVVDPVSSVMDRPVVAYSAPERNVATTEIRYSQGGSANRRDAEDALLEHELREGLTVANGSVTVAVEAFVVRHSHDNQDAFYPLVAALFRLVGFECRSSRRGMNYDRADAMIVSATDSIPIEIKSPGEETEISVKAVRQAVENKVILLSRRQFPTKEGTTSLVVGFNSPNARSEVWELIRNVYSAFGINVGVLDIRTVVGLAIRAVESGARLNLAGFAELRGIGSVSVILAS